MRLCKFCCNIQYNLLEIANNFRYAFNREDADSFDKERAQKNIALYLALIGFLTNNWARWNGIVIRQPSTSIIIIPNKLDRLFLLTVNRIDAQMYREAVRE